MADDPAWILDERLAERKSIANVPPAASRPPTPPDQIRHYRDLNRALLAVLTLTAAWVLARLALATVLPDGLRACSSQLLFHTPCPLCGMTRALVALAAGRAADARALHPFAPAALAALIVEFIFRAAGSTLTGARALHRFRRSDSLTHATLAALYILYAVLFYLSA
jgi:hypothetical protein